MPSDCTLILLGFKLRLLAVNHHPVGDLMPPSILKLFTLTHMSAWRQGAFRNRAVKTSIRSWLLGPLGAVHSAFCLKFEETLYPTPQLVEWRPLRPKWKLERGKGYTIRLMAGSRSVEAKALAESKAVTIALADRAPSPPRDIHLGFTQATRGA